jgi:hypothetical protein
MNVNLSQSLFPVLWILMIAIPVVGLLIWLEIKRSQKLLPARLIAICVAVLALVCLILKPVQSIQKTSDIIVLTTGYEQTILDSLLKENPHQQVYALNGTPVNKKIKVIENYRDLSKLKGNLAIIGQGLPGYMLEYIDTSSVKIYPSPVPEGFISFDQNKFYTVNHTGQIEGIFNSQGKTYSLKLTASQKAEDSVNVTREGFTFFSLKFTPKNPGLNVCMLTAADSSGKIIHAEKIPVQVRESRLLSILVVCNYPSAEIRFLKNFLEKGNHRLTLRYAISKDRYRTEFVNTAQKSIGKINSGMLQDFDLLITDASSVTSLSDSELLEIKEAIKSGLGVVTMIDAPSPSGKANKLLDLQFTRLKNDSANIIIKNKRIKIPATPITIRSERKLFSVLKESSGRTVSGYYNYGEGKSAFQLLGNTFTIQLAGDNDTYAELWSPLLERAARRENKKYDLVFTTPMPFYQDEPIEFEVISAAEPPTVIIDSTEIPLTEDRTVENVWHGKTWAGEPGWHEVTITQDSSIYNFFVAAKDQWGNQRIVNQQKSLHALSTASKKSIDQAVNREISPLIFFILFTLSAGFLWLAPKL